MDELLTQRNKAKEEIENFVEDEAAAKHAEIVRQLRINDAKYIDYHQVQQSIIPDWSYRAFPLYMKTSLKILLTLIFKFDQQSCRKSFDTSVLLLMIRPNKRTLF